MKIFTARKITSVLCTCALAFSFASTALAANPFPIMDERASAQYWEKPEYDAVIMDTQQIAKYNQSVIAHKDSDLFDLDYFKADFSYTVDGDYEGEVAYENFNAAGAVFEFKGVNVHPGEAKDIMVNAALVACELQSSLPENETPAHTENREGFYHLTDMSGDVASAKLSYIVRDHDKKSFESRLNKLRTLEIELNQKYGAGTVTLNITHSYSNMLEIIEQNEYVVDIARKAISNVGLEPLSRPVRGGTDGARLSFMGLPCPNLGTGGYGFHGPYEHISVEGMETAIKVIKEIVTLTTTL